MPGNCGADEADDCETQMATIEERDLLAASVLVPLGKATGQRLFPEVVAFLSMTGHLYDGGLMVGGRAVNGWKTKIRPSALAAPVAAEAYAAEVFAGVTGGACPMTWVTECWENRDGDYNSKNSAFWRATRGIVNQLGIADVNERTWPSHIIWTNLYKVAPAIGGNPTGILRRAQLAGCLRLLALEVAVYRPARILLVTGMKWAAPFLPVLGGPLEVEPGLHYVEGFAVRPLHGVDSVRVVIACHPQGRPEQQWIEEVARFL